MSLTEGRLVRLGNKYGCRHTKKCCPLWGHIAFRVYLPGNRKRQNANLCKKWMDMSRELTRVSFLPYLLTYLLTHSLTYLLTHLLTYLLTYLLTSLLTYLFTYLLTYLLTSLLTHLLTHLLTYLLTHLLTYSFTYSTEQSLSSEANCFLASQEIPRILWNPKVHYPIPLPEDPF
jgi:hypothetical protein